MNVWKTRHYVSDHGGQLTANSKLLVQRQRRTDDQVSGVGNAAQEVGNNWQSVVAVYWRWWRNWNLYWASTKPAYQYDVKSFIAVLCAAYCGTEQARDSFWRMQHLCIFCVSDGSWPRTTKSWRKIQNRPYPVSSTSWWSWKNAAIMRSSFDHPRPTRHWIKVDLR